MDNNKKSIVVVIFIFLIAFAFIGVMDTIKSKEYKVDTPVSTTEPDIKKELIIKNQSGDIDGSNYVINGVVLNNTDEDYASYIISFDLYDNNNGKIKTCSYFGNNIKVSEEQNFNINCDGVSQNIAYYTLSKLEGQK